MEFQPVLVATTSLVLLAVGIVVSFINADTNGWSAG
jgi:hypothetical protein